MKKKKQNKKRSAFGTILLVLLSLAFAGFIWNIVNDSVKEETPIIEEENEPEYETVYIHINGAGNDVFFLYYEGMTWKQAIAVNDNLIESSDGCVAYYYNGDYVYLKTRVDGKDSYVSVDEVVDLSFEGYMCGSSAQ